MKPEIEDKLAAVFEICFQLWQIAFFVACLPVLLAAFAVLVLAPLWLGYVTWSIAISSIRAAWFPMTPELPQQVFLFLGLW